MSRRFGRTVMALGVLAVGGGVDAPAATSQATSFRMPSRNIGCTYLAGSRSQAASLRCDILSGLKPVPRRRCELDWTGISMDATGRAAPTCAGDTAYNARAPVLRYGRVWRRGPFTCISRRTGLRCSNRSRHGFFLARERWRIF
jgi:hypothetical protein